MTAIQVEAIPAFTDNYIWLLHRSGPTCAVVDPGDAAPVLKALDERNLELRTILLTHHHWDHAGGVPDLLEHFDARVYGPADDRLGDWCLPCHEGDTVELAELDCRFSVLDVPAHTRSHIAFTGENMLFSGDTLFSVGCGRLFEGTPAQMQVAMDKFARLAPATNVYCGHEYTLDNCHFALKVEPDNEALAQRAEQAASLRKQGRITLPSTIGQELATNPFMRTQVPSVVQAASKYAGPVAPGEEALGAIRAWKDAS